MLKITRAFLISLVSLCHCVTCSEVFNDDVQNALTYLRRAIGSCGEYFYYDRIDVFINGILELPNIKMGDTVKMTFYGKGKPHSDGIFLPDLSSETLIKRLQSGQTIKYRVDFPITTEVPELIAIFVNGNELCTTKHNSSDEILILEHTMQIINGSLPVFTYNINIPNFVRIPSCGLVDKEIALSPLIYGGSEIVRGEFPWLAAIYEIQGAEIKFLCGSSLVTTRIILSAAHCFQGSNLNADKIIAILGRYNLSNNLEESYVKSEIEVLILHPEYKYGISFSDADLAILKLKNLVSFSKFIKPICLWLAAADESLVVNHIGVVAGWGSDENGATLTEVPKKIKMNIVSEAVCLRSSVAFNGLTSTRTLCAGNRDGSGPCEGDSGGGLMINRHGRWMLRGVISAGLTNQNRCNLQEYTVYCDVAKHTKWLEKYIREEKLLTGSIEEICGVSGTHLRSKHPWLAAVYTKQATGLIFHGAGSLISSRTVLTRAVYGLISPPDYFRIYLGRYDLDNIHETKVVTRDVAQFLMHPKFNKSAALTKYQENGIALIQMKSPVDFTEYVRPICLWGEPNVGQSNITEQFGLLTGWHRQGVHEEKPRVPKSIEVNISSIQQCPFWRNSSRILCAPRLENKTGDNIMTFKRNERWLLRGINAVMIDYLEYKKKDYFVFLDIEKYLPWIQKNMLP